MRERTNVECDEARSGGAGGEGQDRKAPRRAGLRFRRFSARARDQRGDRGLARAAPGPGSRAAHDLGQGACALSYRLR